MSTIVKLGKWGKSKLKNIIDPGKKAEIGFTRRIENIKTAERVIAMTFDDGPMDIPASPDRFNGKSLTDVLLDTLAKYNAKGTFDVIGDTSSNYPDTCLKVGTPSWGGVKYDHYPDFKKDSKGGAVHCDRLIKRLIDEGHQITNHGYSHIIFGKKPFVYGKREYLGDFDKAYNDQKALHDLLKEKYGYTITMARPPHYVDKMNGGYSSYDVYEAMEYQYMAASFDGGGWLPSDNSDENVALDAEVEAMIAPIRSKLKENPDFFSGQIIFQKDGYNMAKRTPVAFALGEQLKLFTEYGYKVVTVNELLNYSQFKDVGREEPNYERYAALSQNHAIAFSDNTLRLDRIMTYGELSMLLINRETYIAEHHKALKSNPKSSRYEPAFNYCVRNNLLPQNASINGEIEISKSDTELFDKIPKNNTAREILNSIKIKKSGPS